MRWVALIILILISVWLVLRFAGTATAGLSYPYPHSYTEGRTLHEVLLVKRGSSVYDPITADRFIAGSNPPLQYLLAAPLVPAGPPDLSQPENVPSILSRARALSLLAALVAAGAAVALASLSRRPHAAWGRGGWRTLAWAAIGGALFLSLPPVLVWSARLEAEMLAVAFTAAGLVCVALGVREREQPQVRSEGEDMETERRLESPNWLLLLLGTLFFTLALYTKQTAVAGPVAAAAYLLLRDPKTGLRWAGAVALLVGVPFIIMEIVTGHWFYLKLFTYSALPARRVSFEAVLGGLWEDAWPLVTLAVGYIAYRAVGSWRQWSRSRGAEGAHVERVGALRPLLLPIFTLSSLLFFPFALTYAPEHNALLMPAFGICACVGALFVRLFADHWDEERDLQTEEGEARRRGTGAGWGARAWAGDAALALVAIYAVLTSPPATLYASDLRDASGEGERLRLIIANAQGNSSSQIFSDDPGLVALAGKDTPYNDPQAMTYNAQVGRWDETAYREKLRGAAFGMILLSCDPTETPSRCRTSAFTPGVLDALRGGYQVVFRDVYFTLVPR
jgi:hypothetical protein